MAEPAEEEIFVGGFYRCPLCDNAFQAGTEKWIEDELGDQIRVCQECVEEVAVDEEQRAS